MKKKYEEVAKIISQYWTNCLLCAISVVYPEEFPKYSASCTDEKFSVKLYVESGLVPGKYLEKIGQHKKEILKLKIAVESLVQSPV